MPAATLDTSPNGGGRAGRHHVPWRADGPRGAIDRAELSQMRTPIVLSHDVIGRASAAERLNDPTATSPNCSLTAA
jgi:hypothetical protein